MRYDYSRLPEALKGQRRFVLWKLGTRPGEDKPTKVPVSALTGYGAKSNDPDTWTDFGTALAKADYYGCDGVGIMLGNGLFGVDIDHALGSGKAEVDEIVNALSSYAEISQSGDGVHILCLGSLPKGRRRKGNVEMYDSARFFALTGNVYEGHAEIRDCTEAIKPIYEKYLGEKKPETPPPSAYVFRRELPKSVFPRAPLTDAEVLEKARTARNASLFNLLYEGQWEGVYPSQSEADFALCSLLAFWTNKDAEQMDRLFRSSKLMRPKWERQWGDGTYGKQCVARAIEVCKDCYVPTEEAASYNPATGEVASPREKAAYPLDDTGNAKRFVDRFGENLRYNFDNKAWYIWDGKTWAKDTKSLVKCYADVLIGEMKKEALDEDDDSTAQALLRNVRHVSSSAGKEAMLKEAQHIGKMPTRNEDYDQDPYLLNCENGVIDLKTGVLLPHDRKYMMSRNTHVEVDMAGEPELWKETIDGIFKGSGDLIDFVQEAVGYSATGDTKETCFFQCYGSGSNGKSLFFSVIADCLGDYALNAQVETILARGKAPSSNASPDIARMAGARFVRTTEPNEGARFNEGLVKQITGGHDKITARFLYASDFEFTPCFKLWIACNYKIAVRGTDKGIWRRMRLIPFEASFEGKKDDKDRAEKLRAEYPRILGWIVRGAMKWQKEGLNVPTEVSLATEEYRTEMDIVASYLAERAKLDPNRMEKASDIYKDYKQWALNGGEYLMSQTKFGLEMGKKFKKRTAYGCAYYCGLELKGEAKQYVYYKEDGKQ